MFEKLNLWICKHFGHRVSDIDRFFLMAELNAIYFSGKIEVRCARCGKNIFPEIMTGYEDKHGDKFKLPEGATY